MHEKQRNPSNSGCAADRAFFPVLTVNVSQDGEFGNEEDRGYNIF